MKMNSKKIMLTFGKHMTTVDHGSEEVISETGDFKDTPNDSSVHVSNNGDRNNSPKSILRETENQNYIIKGTCVQVGSRVGSASFADWNATLSGCI